MIDADEADLAYAAWATMKTEAVADPPENPDVPTPGEERQVEIAGVAVGASDRSADPTLEATLDGDSRGLIDEINKAHDPGSAVGDGGKDVDGDGHDPDDGRES